MGTARAWLPSRKSTLHQRGAAVRTRLGHWRSGRTTGGWARYFFDGSFCMIYGFLIIAVRRSGINKKPTAGPAVGLINFVNNQYPAAAPVSSAFTSSRFRLRFTGTRYGSGPGSQMKILPRLKAPNSFQDDSTSPQAWAAMMFRINCPRREAETSPRRVFNSDF